jgi:hypothetical protein
VTAANLARMSDVDEVASLPFLGGLLRGGAFIGKKRRVNLGGELTIAGQPTSTKARHFLTSVTGVFAAEYGHPIGKKNRIEIGAGGVSGLYFEQLRHNGTTTVTCANRSSLPSSRAGFLLAGRFNLVFLLGKNRNHELGLRLTPGLGLPAEGTKGDNDETGVDCGSEADAFKQLQLDGPELVVTFDIGYAPRF